MLEFSNRIVSFLSSTHCTPLRSFAPSSRVYPIKFFTHKILICIDANEQFSREDIQTERTILNILLTNTCSIAVSLHIQNEQKLTVSMSKVLFRSNVRFHLLQELKCREFAKSMGKLFSKFEMWHDEIACCEHEKYPSADPWIWFYLDLVTDSHIKYSRIDRLSTGSAFKIIIYVQLVQLLELSINRTISSRSRLPSGSMVMICSFYIF